MSGSGKLGRDVLKLPSWGVCVDFSDVILDFDSAVPWGLYGF
jgi:hypothetical protein